MATTKDHLSRNILIGLFSGIAAGLFFGETAGVFSLFGDAFIGLLQMTVLPYIVVSLVASLGKITLAEWKKLLINAVFILALLLFMGIITISVLPLILPEWKSASFFRPEIVALEKGFDFIKLYIPSNPFESLANNVVPAIVLFCIFLGVALTGIKGKEKLIAILDVLSETLNKVNKLVIRLTPYGVFAIAAGSAGTMSLEELGRLQAYIILYSIGFIMLTFWFLPALITSLTPVRYRDIFGVSKSTLITIFATGKIIVVLPQLIENIKEMFAKNRALNEETENAVDIIVPLAYPFPNLGSFAILVFVPFVAWFVGDAIGIGKMPVFIGASLLSSFVSPLVVLPFLLDLLHLPADMFQLFVISSVYTDRIRVVLGAMHLITLSLLAIAFTTGFAKPNYRSLLRKFSAGILIWAALSFAANLYLKTALEGAYKEYDSFVGMTLNKHNVKAEIKKPEEIDIQFPGDNRSRYQIIKSRGSLRVGYLKDQLPFAFRNNKNQLVGFDMDMAYDLADELGVKLTIIKIGADRIATSLNNGQCDIVMSGVPISLSDLDRITYTDTYLSQTMAFIVPDYLKNEYSTSRAVHKIKNLRLAIPQWSYYVKKLQVYIPDAEITVIQSPRDFFTGKTKDIDALVFSAEAGAAWTLIYPRFSVVVPKPDVVRIPLAYPIARDEPRWREFLNNWIQIKKENGTIDGYFHYWIYGKGAESTEKRWSIIKDVLHWVD